MTKAGTTIARRAAIGGTSLELTERYGLFGLRFGRFEFDMTWTSEAQARAAFDEERFALSCGMSPEEEDSGWR